MKTWGWVAAAVAAGTGVALAKKASAASAPPLSTQGKGTINWWSDDDFRNFANMAQRLRMNPADLLIVLYSESGLHPSARNPADRSQHAIAIGLNQLTRAGAPWIPMAEWEDLLNKSVSEQLPYVEKYFLHIPWVAAGNTFESAAQIYLANFAPAKLGSNDPDMVLYSAAHSGAAYTLNRGLDHGNKGFITLRDMGLTAQANSKAPTFLAALDRLRQVTGDRNLSPRFS